MPGKALEIVTRCKTCDVGSPKSYKKEGPSMANCKTEYQATYRDLPRQATRLNMKPDNQYKVTREKTRPRMERKSTYALDFSPVPQTTAPMQYKTEPKRSVGGVVDTTQNTVSPKSAVVSRSTSPNVDMAKLIHPSSNQPIQGETIYTVSFPQYDVATMAASQPPPTKAKNNIEIPSSMETQKKSTAQDDFVHHEHVERPAATRPAENIQRSTDPIDGHTEYKDSYTSKAANVHLCKTTAYNKSQDQPFDAISTTMADFTKPRGFEMRKPCQTSASMHLSTAKFDGATTYNMTYKPSPVKGYELPSWAKKPAYNRPTNGMVVTSVYMNDFRDPGVIIQPKPIKPPTRSNVMKQYGGDCTYEKQTINSHDLRKREDVHPGESYRSTEAYKPPKEKKKVCKSNRSPHITGEKAEKIKPNRQVSQHRELNTDRSVPFVTRYYETCRNPRPKSTPAPGLDKVVHQHPQSAKKATYVAQTTRKSAYPNQIPRPVLKIAQSHLLRETLTITPLSKPLIATINSAATLDGKRM